MDKIIMKGLKFYGYHGVLKEEKALGQEFIIDMELYLDLEEAGKSDNVGDTVSYAEVYEQIKGIVENNQYNLLEALGETIAKNILQKYARVKEIGVAVKKPQAPVNGVFDYFAVEIRRPKK